MKRWYTEEYCATLTKYGITKPKRVLNMDEMGCRVACPRGERVVILIECKELYTRSLENRKSLTIIEMIYADSREPLLPFIIYPRKEIIDNWIHNNLKGGETIISSPIGYTNNEVVIEYLDHLIEHSSTGPNKE